MSEHGYIGYDNLFVADGVTTAASGEQTGFEAINAFDWKQYDWWKKNSIGAGWISASFASAKSADYMAIFGHNMHLVGGTCRAQYSTDGGATWLNASSLITPTDGNLIFIKFTSVSADDWRIKVDDTTGISIIAGVMLGTLTQFDRDVASGFAPSNLSQEIKSKNPMSELGVNLGASVIRTGLKGNLQLNNVSDTWVRSDWTLIIDHFNAGKPAVFVWDETNHSEDAILIWKSGKIPVPSYTSQSYMKVSLPFEGIA